MKYIPAHERAHLTFYPRDLFYNNSTWKSNTDTLGYEVSSFLPNTSLKAKLQFKIPENFKQNLPIRIKINHANINNKCVFNAKVYLVSRTISETLIHNKTKLISGAENDFVAWEWKEISINNCDYSFKDAFVVIIFERIVSSDLDTYINSFNVLSYEIYQNEINNKPEFLYESDNKNLYLSDFEPVNCTDDHTDTEWKIKRTLNNTIEYNQISQVNLTELNILDLNLTPGLSYKASARFKGDISNWGNWSDDFNFTIKAVLESIGNATSLWDFIVVNNILYAVGHIETIAGSERKAFLFKFDITTKHTSYKIFAISDAESGGCDIFTNIISDDDNNLYVCGVVNQSYTDWNIRPSSPVIAKFNADLTCLWCHYYTFNGLIGCAKGITFNSGYIYVTGSHEWNEWGWYGNNFIIKYSKDGYVQYFKRTKWAQGYGYFLGTGVSNGTCALITNAVDNEIYAYGTFHGTSGDVLRAACWKINKSLGSVTWGAATPQRSQSATDIDYFSNGDILFTGSYYTRRVSQSGTLIWTKEYGQSYGDWTNRGFEHACVDRVNNIVYGVLGSKIFKCNGSDGSFIAALDFHYFSNQAGYTSFSRIKLVNDRLMVIGNSTSSGKVAIFSIDKDFTEYLSIMTVLGYTNIRLDSSGNESWGVDTETTNVMWNTGIDVVSDFAPTDNNSIGNTNDVIKPTMEIYFSTI